MLKNPGGHVDGAFQCITQSQRACRISDTNVAWNIITRERRTSLGNGRDSTTHELKIHARLDDHRGRHSGHRQHCDLHLAQVHALFGSGKHPLNTSNRHWFQQRIPSELVSCRSLTLPTEELGQGCCQAIWI